MMGAIPEFSENEMWLAQTTLQERYGREITPQIVDTELRLRSSDRELTACPALYWEDGDCHFVVCKTGEKAYRCQFFYRLHEQFSTGIEEFDDLAECMVTLLQTQADHASSNQQSAES